MREALERMSLARVGTIAVVDAARQPLGIFTLTDLMQRVSLPALPLKTPVGDVMTAAPVQVDAEVSAQEAMTLMAARDVHQLLVTRGGALCGVISERDLYALQRTSLRDVQQSLRAAATLGELGITARRIGELIDNLLAQGASADHVTRLLSLLNDNLVQRVLSLLTPQFTLPPRWCWLALGSEGRREQTMITDQDNAILFDAAVTGTEASRQQLLRFAAAANRALADLGFELCPGNIMAGNPECCLSTLEWQRRFAGWLSEPTPDALLQANIYFDLRSLYGESALATELRRWVLGRSEGNRLFLGLLVANALSVEPPLGLIRTFRTDDAAHPGTLDLKTQGTRLFVDAARALSLAFGIDETNSVQRLHQACARLHVPEREVTGITQAFDFLQGLRLRGQRNIGQEPLPPEAFAARTANRIDPYALSDPDQRLLKESFRQARQLQGLLAQFVGHGAALQ